MLFLRRGRSGLPITCPAPSLDPPCAGRAAPGPDTVDTARAFADISELVGAELNSAIGQVKRQSQRIHQHGDVVVQVARDIALQAREITQTADGVNANVTAVAATGEELSASAREIASQAARSAGTARAATLSADEAVASFTALSQTVDKIAAMSKAIAAIASRTNLLALNATIEAARAGDAGRGFAVVAGEVKELSRQTRTATDDIARCIGEVQRAMELSVAAVSLVGNAVRSMDADSAAVAASAEQQNGAIDVMAERLQRTAASVTEVTAKIDAISGGSERVERLAIDMQGEIEAADARLDEVRSNVVVSLRRMTAVASHNERLIATEMPACLVLPLGRRQVTVLELSDSTAILRLAPGVHEQFASLASNATVKLSVGEGAPIEVDVLASSSTRLVVRARGLAGHDEAPFASIVSEITAKDAHFSEAARRLAAQLSGCLDEAVAQGRCTEADIFDSAYVPIEGTDPQQFTTRFCGTADALVRPLLDSLLTFDPRVVGTLVADRNGYTPTHNARCSLPQRLDDPLWNAVNCRNRRMFDDRAGLAAGNTTRDVLVQCYERDMGGGRIMTVREADAPIRVGGRHWGGLRLMYRGEATN